MIAEYFLGAAIRIVGSCVFIVCLLMSINYQSLVLAVLACAGALLAAGASISTAILLLSMENKPNKEDECANPDSRSKHAANDHQVT